MSHENKKQDDIAACVEDENIMNSNKNEEEEDGDTPPADYVESVRRGLVLFERLFGEEGADHGLDCHAQRMRAAIIHAHPTAVAPPVTPDLLRAAKLCWDGARPKLPPSPPTLRRDTHDVLVRCFSRNAEKRPDIEEIELVTTSYLPSYFNRISLVRRILTLACPIEETTKHTRMRSTKDAVYVSYNFERDIWRRMGPELKQNPRVTPAHIALLSIAVCRELEEASESDFKVAEVEPRETAVAAALERLEIDLTERQRQRQEKESSAAEKGGCCQCQ